VLLCVFLARPIANMGIIDDAAYVSMARTVAATGHIAYNGWSAGMLGWQLYLAAAFIKLFGFSFTVVRSSTVLVAMVMAFVLHRTLVRAGVTERNATLGTLALVLSPMYLMLSATFMTDITGLFGIVVCLYGCLSALQSSSDRTAIAWLCFAVLTNALFGSSRQIAWLGILVMLPSTLWLLRSRRRVLITGAAATLAGALFIFAALQWLKHQPYVVPEHLNFLLISPRHILGQLTYFSLDAPFLLLPALALFLPELRKLRLRVLVPLSALALAYTFLALYPSHLRGRFPLEPLGECVNPFGSFAFPGLQSTTSGFLPPILQALFTLLAFAGLLGLVTLLCRSSGTTPAAGAPISPSWHQLRILLIPYCIAYAFLISFFGATLEFHDRYLLGLLVVAILCLFRYYQQHSPPSLPLASVLLIAVMAIYSILANHQMFAFYRARALLASELLSAGIPPTSVDNGWEYNFGVELQHADHINGNSIEWPPHAYVPRPPLTGICTMNFANLTPHISPLYSVSFDPNACYGPAPFAPVHYSRWPHTTPGTLYVVRFTPTPPATPGASTRAVDVRVQ